MYLSELNRLLGIHHITDFKNFVKNKSRYKISTEIEKLTYANLWKFKKKKEG